MTYLLAITACLSSNLLFIQSEGIHTADYVFFEMAPYLYYKNGTLHGAYVDMFAKMNAICHFNLTLKYDVKTIQNMTNILENPAEHTSLFNNNTHWLTLTYTISDELARDNGLASLEDNWAPGIEVVMHRHQIALLVKIWGAIIDCRHLISLVIILTACFGILIWIAVSRCPVILIKEMA